MSETAGELARLWLEAWNTGDLELLRLHPDFVHTSPFGRLEGAENYLSVVEPMSRKSVQGITVRDVIEGDGRAAVAYEVDTPAGPVEACDWVFAEDGLITRVESYYDPTKNREALETDTYE